MTAGRPAVARCALAILTAGCTVLAAHASEPLRVCIAEHNPPLSYRVGGPTGRFAGLDVRLAQVVADALGRPLDVVPFESRHDADSTLAQEVGALLASGVCDLASGYALLAADLGAPARATARVPDHPGAKRRPLRDWVALLPMVGGRPYHTVAMGLVVGDAARAGATLGQPGDARIGVVAGTLAGTATTLVHGGRLRAQTVSLAQTEDPFEALEAGRIDATLTSVDRYDAWRLAHPATRLRLTSYRHPLRFNLGFVAASTQAGLLAAADRVVDAATARGDLARWTEEAGATWTEPTVPAVSPPFTLDMLRSGD